MAELTDAEYEAATARGREKLRAEPRARSARYDPDTGRVVVELVNGCTYIFPAELASGAARRGPRGPRRGRGRCDGLQPALARLDADLSVPATVAGVFGTRDWMARAWAQEAGRTSTPAKAEAARRNGAKGGRPRKRAG